MHEDRAGAHQLFAERPHKPRTNETHTDHLLQESSFLILSDDNIELKGKGKSSNLALFLHGA